MAFSRNPDDAIAEARRTLAAWKRIAGVSPRPDEVVRLLESQAHSLATLALQYPHKAVAAARLIAAYDRLLAQMNDRMPYRAAAAWTGDAEIM